MNSQDVILGLLLNRPRSGYEIKSAFEAPLAYFFDASFGTIYPTLAKLEKLGYIEKENVVQDNRPNKNVYSITDSGRERFMAYMNSPLDVETYRSDFMVRLFFGEHQSREKLIEWIRRGIEQAKREVSKLREERKRWDAGMSPSQRICADLGVELNESKIRVLEEGLRQFEEQLQ
ncbi:PadR family transcriptional regulator [Cohnella lubricantis]|uniref:PadR family transcriptional regulator n=1 Tax=Cohnella lubricantis TaxID=2163172 RepID=A0A841TCC6_9BACL|nr:PadR family transcriptional regulator [Cohnella lubricantis]MBB6677669.1 PadR family transcriptional regulator [Cohnella lubricantis]MBP2117630.1 DNA-binding PadR family transcriptional regulator [Cohnella lubricantis]